MLRFLVPFALVAACAPAQAPEFPPFPTSQQRNYPTDPAGLWRMSKAGDSYASLRLATFEECAHDDDACLERKFTFLRLARQQGESSAEVVERLLILDGHPERASNYAIGKAVCGRTLADLPDIASRMKAVSVPAYAPTPRSNEPWLSEERTEPGGIKLQGYSNGPFSAVFVFRGDNLIVLRTGVIALEVGSQEERGSLERWEAIKQLVGVAMQSTCPEWSGLAEASSSYVEASLQVWPPRAVHVTGPSAYFWATAVTPDIAWFDLYVEPNHDPTTSGLAQYVGGQ